MTHPPEIAGTGFGHLGGGAGPAIHSQGHSGCEVRLIGREGQVFVEKSSRDSRYNSRLGKQIQKQKGQGASNRLRFVRIPKILEEEDRDGLLTARMEYVYFLDSLDYFASASVIDIDRVVEMITGYIDAAIGESRMVEVAPGVFGEKLAEIEANLKANGHFAEYRAHLGALGERIGASAPIVLPVGRCHGDLTFSNIMIASDSRAIALIDFLDSFIESPIIDIAKVRQDSRFCWSLLMASREVDPVRFRMVMRYIDSKIVEHYAGLDWFSRNIDLVLALNLLRIAPYAKRPDVHEFLLDAIGSLELRR